MAQLVWGTVGQRYYETGIDRGVLFIDGEAVAWNGLTSVNEAPAGGEAKPFYLDGIKYANISAAAEYASTIEAFSSPRQFARCDGTASLGNGLFATEQPRKSFNFSYRTRVGNDVEGTDFGYKIHLVYNALTAPTTRNYASLTNSVEAGALSWAITTVPPRVTGIKPTAHLIIDSSQTPSNLLAAIEDILYGTETTAPRFPDIIELSTMFNEGGLIILYNWTRNPEQVATGSTAEKLGRYSWTISTTVEGVTSATRLTRNTGSNGPDRGIDWYQNADLTPGRSGTAAVFVPVSIGDRLVVAFDSRASKANVPRRIKLRIHDGVGNWVSDYLIYSPIPTTTSWQRIKYDFIVPNTGYLVVRNVIDSDANWLATDWIEQTHLQISPPNDYFSGDTESSDDVAYEWTGEPNNSSSVARSWLVQPYSQTPNLFSSADLLELDTVADDGSIEQRQYFYVEGSSAPTVGQGQEVIWLDTSGSGPATLNIVTGD
jgi:hypothetical protein